MSSVCKWCMVVVLAYFRKYAAGFKLLHRMIESNSIGYLHRCAVTGFSGRHFLVFACDLRIPRSRG